MAGVIIHFIFQHGHGLKIHRRPPV